MSGLMFHRNHHDVLNYHANDANDARECRLMPSRGSVPAECMRGWMINSVSCMTGHTRQWRIATFILVSPHKPAVFEDFSSVRLQLAQIIGLRSVSESFFLLSSGLFSPTLSKSNINKELCGEKIDIRRALSSKILPILHFQLSVNFFFLCVTVVHSH